MMSYRYFRLTPPYLLVIGLIQISMKWYHDHSIIELTSLDHQTCEKFWWRNALYLNTYFDMEDRVSITEEITERKHQIRQLRAQKNIYTDKCYPNF